MNKGQGNYDILIAGGGLAGSALALALTSVTSRWRIGLIDASAPQQHQQSQTVSDMRCVALAKASQHILIGLNLWPAISLAATPIQRIHISEKKRFGSAILDANEIGLPAFGYAVPIPILFNALQEALKPFESTIDFLRPAKITALNAVNDGWDLTINNNVIKTRLLIAADGDHSFIRNTLNLPTEQEDYAQAAIVVNINFTQHHQFTAYERFLKNGSIAFIPQSNHQAALIWISDKETINNLFHLSDADFLLSAQKAFGYRLGKLLTLGKRQTYPLHKIHAKEQTHSNLVLLGNAAHTLHPIAAQGFNLTLRDIADLAEILITAKDISDNKLLREYEKKRQQDQQQTMRFTQHLVKLFAQQAFPIPTFRSIGLTLFDLLPFAKNRFSFRRMGLTGHLSKLARGLSLPP